jgi:hypothetical protein
VAPRIQEKAPRATRKSAGLWLPTNNPIEINQNQTQRNTIGNDNPILKANALFKANPMIHVQAVAPNMLAGKCT